MNDLLTCPHVGWSGGCDDCGIGLESMTCEEELREYEVQV